MPAVSTPLRRPGTHGHPLPATTTVSTRTHGALGTLALACTLLLSGCAAQNLHEDGLRALAAGDAATALSQLRQASELDPGNARYRVDYLAQRNLALQALNTRADAARNGGRADEAAALYREALALDPGQDRALRGLQALQDQVRITQIAAQAERHLADRQPETARDQLRRALREWPGQPQLQALLRQADSQIDTERAERERQSALQSASRKPVTLQFRDANLKMVFEALSRTSGLNIILDRDVRSDLKTTIYVQNASVEDTIDLILLQNQLDKRVLSANTLFIYPATAAKQREYAELKVRSFQLSNIEAAQMASILKSMLKTRDVVTDVRTNTLVMRDTVEAIAVAEKLVAANDVPDPEVMLEVEVLEVSSDRLTNLGLKFPDALSISTPSSANTLSALRALTPGALNASGLSLGLNLLLQDTDTNILASPRIRARHKEKARILVGDKVPVITNLISPQPNGGNSVITGSIQYVDVGIKLEVEPQVYNDGDVGIKVNLEVSNISRTLTTQSGVAYQIGTRNATTSLRLRDGETQVLAGLINDQDRSTANKLPGLGQLPALGRLFSSTNANGSKSEIVLSITPRIVRAPVTTEARYGDVWSGTENLVRERPLRVDPLLTVRGGGPAGVPAAIAPAQPAIPGAATGIGPTGPVPVTVAPAGAITAPLPAVAPVPANTTTVNPAIANPALGLPNARPGRPAPAAVPAAEPPAGGEAPAE